VGSVGIKNVTKNAIIFADRYNMRYATKYEEMLINV